MMKILPVKEVLGEKIRRQNAIKELKYSAYGYFVYLGQLSPGCYKCSFPDTVSMLLPCGQKCNLDCPYCAIDKDLSDFSDEIYKNNKQKLFLRTSAKTKELVNVALTGGGEPLLYMDEIRKYMAFIKELELKKNFNFWCHIYTNGLLACEETIHELHSLGIDEIRFHLGASNFSSVVYENLEHAAKHFKTVSVETVAWPLHRKELLKMLPKLEDLGVKHLNVAEIKVAEYNVDKIIKAYPSAEFYFFDFMHLYDKGLVYDLFEEHIKKSCTFSILNCDSLLKSFKNALPHWRPNEDNEGLCRL